MSIIKTRFALMGAFQKYANLKEHPKSLKISMVLVYTKVIY